MFPLPKLPASATVCQIYGQTGFGGIASHCSTYVAMSCYFVCISMRIPTRGQGQLTPCPPDLTTAGVIVQGMLQLHSHPDSILHRDLKSPNLLVDRHWRVKVTDFNLSSMVKSYTNACNHSSTAATNPRWLAPEVTSLPGPCTDGVPAKIVEMKVNRTGFTLLRRVQEELIG